MRVEMNNIDVTRGRSRMQAHRVIRVLLAAMILVAAFSTIDPGYAGVTINVDTFDDELNKDGDCSLREAIVAANTDTEVDACPAGLGDDTIFLPKGTFTISIPGLDEDHAQTGDLDLLESVTIQGAGISATIIEGSMLDRVFDVQPDPDPIVIINEIMPDPNMVSDSVGEWLELFNPTDSDIDINGWTIKDDGSDSHLIDNGSPLFVPAGGYLVLAREYDLGFNGGVSANTADYGGGIYNEATLNVQNGSTIGGVGVGNIAANHGGGIYNVVGTTTVDGSTVSTNTAFWGGGIYTLAGTTMVTKSTFSGNSADQSGGIGNNGSLTISNSTFSGNSATGVGGGIDNYDGVLTISNSTFSGNSATTGGGIINSSSGTLNLKNNIVADSLSGGDCVNLASTIATNVNNLIEDGSCSPALMVDPLLGPLTDSGGPTETMALLSGSPAIDAGDNPTCEAADQRGWSRPIDGDLDGIANCDIGAYEKTIDLFLPLIMR